MSDDVRELSKRLFKAGYRLEVGAEIAERVRTNERFTNKELALALGDPPGKNGISGELKTLRSAGLIRRDGSSDRTKYLRAEPSSYWEMCRELKARASEHLSAADDD